MSKDDVCTPLADLDRVEFVDKFKKELCHKCRSNAVVYLLRERDKGFIAGKGKGKREGKQKILNAIAIPLAELILKHEGLLGQLLLDPDMTDEVKYFLLEQKKFYDKYLKNVVK